MALRPVVFSGPSGTGKSTLLSLLFKEFPNTFGFSVSHTTRKPRPGEEDGKHYHFTTIDDMQQEIEQGKFIEHAKFSGNLYGTSLKAVQDLLDMKTICLLDIDEQGVKSIKKTEINPLYVFVAPPSLKVLRSRLESRGTETAETIEKRMATAISAMEYSKEPGVYDVTIVNDKLDQAYQELRCFLLKQYPSLTSQEVATSTENDDGPSSTAVSEEAKNEDDTKTNVTTEQSTSVKDSNKEMSKTDVVLPLAEPSMETTMSNNESITDISLSPVKLRVDPDDDIPAIMKVDATIDVSGNGVVTSENQNSSVIVTRQSSVINMEPEPANESSAVCGDATWGSCLIL